ncbi:hypothetical protein A2780_02535 [Candidatus Daviesbacteria bacterium RIFCSPHIGHO2_01_FULL_41_45]|nr:MAG: hypothetical protein A2780_02535 [Candidatus Daviesbacteria bacterium RIFCSPHIGHO2_01_FULL_41_45]
MDKTLKQSKYKTLVRFENGMEIKADPMNWVLYIPSPRSYSYYPTLDCVFIEILDLRIKELATKDSRRTLQSLADAISQAKTEIESVLTQLTTPKIAEQGRLGVQEGGLRVRND